MTTTRRRSLASLAPTMATILLSLVACGSSASRAPAPSPAPATAAPIAATESPAPDWFDIRMTDVLTGQAFAIGDFEGKVVLIETMAEWCPTCIEQGAEVKRLHELLPDADLVSVSLDIDLHEDEASLKKYATDLGYDWRFAVAPLEVARALGNLYSAEYLNPPLAPMLLIDRHGVATSLPYGVKPADYLRTTVEPHLAP